MIPIMVPEYCKGCNICVMVCPRKVFDRGEEPSPQGYFVPLVARPEDCLNYGIGRGERLKCELCWYSCPDRVIEYEEE